MTVSVYDKHRIHLTDLEVNYIYQILSDNLTGMVKKPEPEKREIHLAVLGKFMRHTKRLADGD
jgi:hypothetical protein